MMAFLPLRRLLAAAALLIFFLASCGTLPNVPPPRYPYPIPNQGGR